MLDKKNYQVGLEVEHFRVLTSGQISELPHPDVLRTPHFNTDALISQLEIISGVETSADAAVARLEALYDQAQQALSVQEQLWPYTMPPAISEDRHELHYSAETPERLAYYQMLEQKFGLTGALPMGAHMNISFDGFSGEDYARVARALLAYRWLFTYFSGASPFANEGYWDQEIPLPVDPIRSLRGSWQFGYGFASHMTSDFSSVQAYAQHVQALIDNGTVIKESAYREVVRLRHREGLAGLQRGEVHYLELRLFDLDPDTPAGISDWLVKFVLLFALYAVAHDIDYDWQTAVNQHNEVALENPLLPTVYQGEAEQLLAEMSQYFSDLGDELILNQARQLLQHPELTPAARIMASQPDLTRVG
jgi:glutamate--cysteine ligase